MEIITAFFSFSFGWWGRFDWFVLPVWHLWQRQANNSKLSESWDEWAGGKCARTRTFTHTVRVSIWLGGIGSSHPFCHPSLSVMHTHSNTPVTPSSPKKTNLLPQVTSRGRDNVCCQSVQTSPIIGLEGYRCCYRWCCLADFYLSRERPKVCT